MKKVYSSAYKKAMVAAKAAGCSHKEALGKARIAAKRAVQRVRQPLQGR